MTESVSPAIDLASHLFKTLIYDTEVDALIGLITYYCPPFAVFPLNKILSGLMHKLFDKFYSFLKLFVDTSAIPIINGERRAAYDSATIQLEVIYDDYGINSPQFKKAHDDAKAQLSRFSAINR